MSDRAAANRTAARGGRLAVCLTAMLACLWLAMAPAAYADSPARTKTPSKSGAIEPGNNGPGKTARTVQPVEPVEADGPVEADEAVAAMSARDRALIDERLARMPAQRPGQPDLFAVSFAGDGRENVFRNEAAYFETLATARYGAHGRTLALVNHPDSLDAAPRPLATLDNLHHALAGIAARMDPEEDMLLLFLTSHGKRRHALVLNQPGSFDASLSPSELRAALDDAGIRHRLLIVSACFSGGFIPALAAPDTVVITAARHDRTSFGCGDASSATYFGQALLVEGLNRDGGLLDAFAYAQRQVARREKKEGHVPSYPQIHIGEDIRARLLVWEAALERDPPLAYPHPL